MCVFFLNHNLKQELQVLRPSLARLLSMLTFVWWHWALFRLRGAEVL